MKKENKKQLIIYQGKDGKIEFRGDFDKETIWGTQKQIAEVFGVDVRTINEHIQNVYKDKELIKKSTIRKIRIVQIEGDREVNREVNFYNLDVIILVGYRVNSKNATQFRIWATETLKKHLIDGYTMNKKRIKQNYNSFLKAVEQVRTLLPADSAIQTQDILELINTFASTWFSLGAYDTEMFPKKGVSKKKVLITAEELESAIAIFKKNHPFVDGNKRTGAFSFVWFLNRVGILSRDMTAPSLTALTLLIAESKPRDKEKMIGLVLLLLKRK